MPIGMESLLDDEAVLTTQFLFRHSQRAEPWSQKRPVSAMIVSNVSIMVFYLRSTIAAGHRSFDVRLVLVFGRCT